MAQDPLFIVALAVGLFLCFLAVFTLFTYLYLRLAVNLRLAEKKKKE